MPLYDYERPDGTIFELWQDFRDDPLTHDPQDATIPVIRIFHAPAIHFKGAGFYNTDYRRKNHGAPVKDETTPQETKEKVDNAS